MADKMRVEGFDDDIRNMLYTSSKRTGSDPSFLFEVIETIIRKRSWEYLKDKDGNPVGSFKRLITEKLPVGIGMDETRLKNLLALPHKHESKGNAAVRMMIKLRKDVGKLLEWEIDELHYTDIETAIELGSQGGRGNTKGSDISDPLKTLGAIGGTSRQYRIALLKRDAPDIAERVINDEISAAKGIRELRARQGKPERERIAISLIDALSAYKTLIKHMPSDVLEELIQLLDSE